MFEAVDVATGVDPGPRPSVDDVSSAIDDAVALQAQIDALEGRKLLAVERARRAAAGCERALLDDGDLEVRRASRRRRRELASRAFTADLATALRLSEQQAAHLVDTARTLTAATDLTGPTDQGEQSGPTDQGEQSDLTGQGDNPSGSTLVELCRGRFSLAHARAMADTLAELPDGIDNIDGIDDSDDSDGAGPVDLAEARARVQAAALPAAAHTTLPQFRRRLRRARDLAHPRPLTERHRTAVAKRAVHLDPGADGMAWLTAYLPAPHAHAAHDRLTRTGRQAKQAGDCRTLDQLRADALVDLLLTTTTTTSTTTTTGPSETAGALPGIGATGAGGLSSTAAPEATGAAGAGGFGSTAAPGDVRAAGAAGLSETAALGPDVPEPDVPELADVARRIVPSVRVTVPVTALLGGDDPADLDGHGPLDADTAARLSAHAPSLRRLLTDPVDGRVLTTDPGTYTVPTALRTYLQARDATCRFPGCTRRATGCDLDHIVAWADGGRTTADNLSHLCRHHHVLKHQTRWRTTHGQDGDVTWTSPTGRTHHDQPSTTLEPNHPTLDLPPLEPPGLEPPRPEASSLHPPARALPDLGPPPF